jgi:phage host-nuclease inhibitor protein Gam
MGELGVSLAAMTNELEDTREGLAQDGDFLAELSGGCATKKQEWEVVKATRQQELLAIAETIKVLNDDDALDLFKKTLPTPAASFVEIKVNAAAMRARAITFLRRAQGRPELDLIALAINGKKIGFEKVVAMIDSMVANLKVEQRDDDNKKEYCDSQFDLSDDKKKGLENSITDSESAIEEMRGAIATLKEEIAALTAGIQALDKSVAEATAQRKAEHDDYNELIANNAAAKELMLWAKNRLNKFYNPKLYKAAPKRVLSEEERITLNMGGTLAPTSASGIADTGISVALLQTSAHSAGVAAPPPPPATFGAYSKKPEGTGVIAMIDLLVADLDKETTEATTEENDAQSDYEKAMSGAAKKRAQDSKSLTDKSAERAKLEESLGEELDQKDGLKKDLGATLKYIHSLHAECDWLLKYFEVRKQARTGEIESLGQAKAVLNGADFALLQTKHSLRQQHSLSPQ